MSSQNENFICECDEWLRTSCKNEVFFKQHSGKNYCVLHYPDFDKLDNFSKAIQRKIDNHHYDFKGVWFPIEFNFQHFDVEVEMDFSSAFFSKETKFISTKFRKRVDFSNAHFQEIVYFNSAEFHLKTNFFKTHFEKDVWFSQAEFKEKVVFSLATFGTKAFFKETNFVSEADFIATNIFNAISFQSATFQDYVTFSGDVFNEQQIDKKSFDFQFTRFKKPELVSFHSGSLSPSWFVNVDSRKLVFTRLC